MPVRIQLPWDIPEVEGLSTEFQPEGARLIPLESTRQGTRWGRCGRDLPQFHGYDRPIQLRYLPLWERLSLPQLPQLIMAEKVRKVKVVDETD